MLIFISHSHEDVDLASALLKFIVAALKIDESQVRCTSVPGYKLPVGSHSSATLRREIDEASAFIGILSPKSLASSYVLFELGARWGLDRAILSVLAPNMKFSDIQPPLSEHHIARIDSKDDLLQLIDQLTKDTRVSAKNRNIVESAVKELIDSLAKRDPGSKETSEANRPSPEEPVFDGQVYWKKKDGMTKDGPFCQCCFDSERKLIRLQDKIGVLDYDDAGNPSGSYRYYECLICKNSYDPEIR